jgi:hypothetical protein
MALLLELAVSGAHARGLRVLSAMYASELDVIFAEPDLSVAEVLDLAQSMAAPFITVEATEFDFQEFLVEMSDGDGSARSRRRPSPLAYVTVKLMRWSSDGSPPVPTTRSSPSLSGCRKSGSCSKTEVSSWPTTGSRILRRGGRGELSLRSRLKPCRRSGRWGSAAARASRCSTRSVCWNLGDGVDVLVGAVRDAVEAAGANSQTLFAEIEADFESVAAELVQSASWNVGLRAPERLALTKKYLIERTGGYGPTTVVATLVCNAAVRLAHKRPA